MELNQIQPNTEKPKTLGRKIDPVVLAKYEQIYKVIQERPNEFSRRELCHKHEVNYHNFSQWLQGQLRRAADAKGMLPKFRPELKQTPQLSGTSVIMVSLDDLFVLLSPMLKIALRDALLDGIKQEKVKALPR